MKPVVIPGLVERKPKLFTSKKLIKMATVTKRGVNSAPSQHLVDAIMSAVVRSCSTINTEEHNAPTSFILNDQQHFEYNCFNVCVRDNIDIGIVVPQGGNSASIYFDYASTAEYRLLISTAAMLLKANPDYAVNIHHWFNGEEILLTEYAQGEAPMHAITQVFKEELRLPTIQTKYKHELITITPADDKEVTWNDYRGLVSKMFKQVIAQPIDWNEGIIEENRKYIRQEIEMYIPVISKLPVRVLFQYTTALGLDDAGYNSKSLTISIATDVEEQYQFALDLAKALFTSKYKNNFMVLNPNFANDLENLYARNVEDLETAQEVVDELLGLVA